MQDDCYLSEISALVDVVDGKAPQSAILSTYADALESYKLVCRSVSVSPRNCPAPVSGPCDELLIRRADLGNPERRREGVRGARRSEAVGRIRNFICMMWCCFWLWARFSPCSGSVHSLRLGNSALRP